MRISIRYATAAALCLACVPTQAAETIGLSSNAQAEVPVAAPSAFDWSGFYAGIYGVAESDSGNGAVGLGVQAGVNAQFDFYLVGADVAVQGLNGAGSGGADGQLLGRAGLVVTDNVLVYAAGGYGLALDSPNDGAGLLGGGLEVGLTDSVSLEGRYLRSFPVDGSAPAQQLTLGANFHF